MRRGQSGQAGTPSRPGAADVSEQLWAIVASAIRAWLERRGSRTWCDRPLR
jgi:hypothetical protein